jgi:hypothetical protein
MALHFDGKKNNWKRSLFVEFGKRYGLNKIVIEKELDRFLTYASKNKQLLFEIPMSDQRKRGFEKVFNQRALHLAGDL